MSKKGYFLDLLAEKDINFLFSIFFFIYIYLFLSGNFVYVGILDT